VLRPHLRNVRLVCILYTMQNQALFTRPTSVRNEVYEHLKLEILRGTLEAGTRLAEIPLSERLGVSRTPVREAMQRLAQDGLVQVEVGKGAKVRGISSREIEEIYAVREVLDGLAAQLAAKNRKPHDLRAMKTALHSLEHADTQDYNAQVGADLEFHRTIAAASGNSILEQTLSSLTQQVARVKLLTREYNQNIVTQTAHHTIFAAIEQRDAAAAEQAAREHVRDFRALLLRKEK
jgi:GntR family transcriptional regulator, rspAB operon transcriptional repressor